MTSLTIKHARALRPWGQHEDYDVLVDGKFIGRIYHNGSVGTPPDMRWFWSHGHIRRDNGTAATREEACTDFVRRGTRSRNTGPTERVCYLKPAVESAIFNPAPKESACALDQEGLTKCCNLHHRTAQLSEVSRG